MKILAANILEAVALLNNTEVGIFVFDKKTNIVKRHLLCDDDDDIEIFNYKTSKKKDKFLFRFYPLM